MATDKIILYEDNAGGLHMTDGIDVVSGFEHNRPGSLIGDIATWDQWIEDATHRTAYADWIERCDRIAAYDGETVTINVKAMGIAGKRYAGV